MKDLGETGLILGTKIICSSEGFAQSQSHYTDKILKNFNHFESESKRTPYDPSLNLRKNKWSIVSQIEYTKIIGN
jgi:hypothetical protein